jgi:hypothetical protein
MAEETQILNIKVKINRDTNQLEIINTDLNKLGQSVDKVSEKTKIQNISTQASEGGFRRLGNALGLDLTAMASTTGAAILMAKVLRDSVEATEQEDTRQRVLASTLKGLGLNYDKLKDSIEGQLAVMDKNTKFTRSDTLEAFNKTLRITGDVNSAYKLLKITMDTSVATGKSFTDTLDTFNSALKNPQRGVNILAGEFGKLGVQGKTAAEMITNLGKTYAGASGSTQTLGTMTKGLSDAYALWTQTIGGSLMPVISLLITVLKGVMMPVLATLTVAVTALKIAFDTLLEPITVIMATMQGGWRGGVEAVKDYFKTIKKEYTDGSNFMDKTQDAFFGTQEKKQQDFGNAQLKAIRDMQDKTQKEQDKANKEYEKMMAKTEAEIKKINEQEVKDEEKAANEKKRVTDDLASHYSGVLAPAMQTAFNDMVTSGKITQKELNGIFKSIEESFEQTLEKMVADMIAKQVFLGLFNAISGGGGGSILNLLTGGSTQGVFDVGGTVPADGNYRLKKGETIGRGASTTNQNSTININLGVSTVDLRSVAQPQLNRLARQLEPYITKEQGLKRG